MRHLLSGLALAVACAVPSVGTPCDGDAKASSHSDLFHATGVATYALTPEDFAPVATQGNALGAQSETEALVELGILGDVPVHIAQEPELVELGFFDESAALDEALVELGKLGDVLVYVAQEPEFVELGFFAEPAALDEALVELGILGDVPVYVAQEPELVELGFFNDSAALAQPEDEVLVELGILGDVPVRVAQEPELVELGFFSNPAVLAEVLERRLFTVTTGSVPAKDPYDMEL